MNVDLGPELIAAREDFDRFLQIELRPHLPEWERQGAISREFFTALARHGWLGYAWDNDRLVKRPGLRETLLLERLAETSPGV